MKHQKIALCPVCQMQVEIQGVGRVLRTQYYQETYYFCSESCLRIFKKNPEDYVRRQRDRD